MRCFRRGAARAVAVCAVFALSTSAPLSAQWYASGSFGSSADLDATTDTPVRSFQLGLTGLTDLGRLQLSGGIPLQPSENLLWGFGRVAASPFIGSASNRGFGLRPSLAAEGYVYHDPAADVNGTGGKLTAEPYVVYAARDATIGLGGGFRAAGTHATGDGSPGSILQPGEALSTAITAGVVAADVRLSPARRVSVTGHAESLFIEGTALPHAAFRLTVGFGGGALWGGVDHWASDRKRDTGWDVGASLNLTSDLAAIGSVGRFSGDPMFGTSPSETWSLGLRYRIGSGPGEGQGGLPTYDAGAVQLRIPAAGGRDSLYVAGSFNGWRKLPMRRSGDDYTIELPLDPGYYELAFVDETGEWFVPEGMTGRRRDGMGGWVLALVVQ